MGSFFKNFPTVKYRDRYAPNILAIVKLSYDYLKSAEVYHPFLIGEGDRPDTVADLYYRDPEADWLIYMANNIIDVNSQWPLTNTQLTNYIQKKYGSFSASSEIKHYFLKRDIPALTQTQYDNIPDETRKYWTYNINSSTYEITTVAVTITPTAFAALEAREQLYWTPETFYDYEFRINEEKRKIRLIDRRYKEALEETLKNILNDRE